MVENPEDIFEQESEEGFLNIIKKNKICYEFHEEKYILQISKSESYEKIKS